MEVCKIEGFFFLNEVVVLVVKQSRVESTCDLQQE